MKKLSDIINEVKGDPIDMQWINDEKPVITKDGRQAIVLNVDLNEIPNLIKGKVKIGDDLIEYEWIEDGTCIKAIDRNGNPKKTSENDKLVKGI